MSDFSRRQLRYFIAVAEELHFGRAAQRLHISQPPLSQQIALLESDLGVMLLDRNRRKVELTEAGRQFLEDARSILSGMSAAATRAQGVAEGRVGVLRIGLNYSAPFHPLPPELFRNFVTSHPNVRLELQQATGVSQLVQLRQRALDLCFLWPTRDDVGKDLEIHALDEDEVHLAIPEDHPLAHKKTISASDLRDEVIFLMPWQLRTDFYAALIGQCEKQDFEPSLRTDIVQMPFALTLVAAGQGISFVSRFLDVLKPRGVVFREVEFLPKKARRMPFCIASLAGNASPIVANFINAAR